MEKGNNRGKEGVEGKEGEREGDRKGEREKMIKAGLAVHTLNMPVLLLSA